MKNTLSVFNLKQQKNIQIKIKNQSKFKIKISNLIFQIHSKLYLGFLDYALYPAARAPYIWGLLYCALYPAHERLFVFARERSFLSRTKV